MQTCQRISALVIGTLLALAVTTQAQEQPAAAVPQRPSWPGMTPTGAVLLPNGWTLQPAGRQIPVGDLPILIAECPSAPVLALLHAGWGEHEIITVNPNGKTIARATVPETYGGLVWSSDGKRLFVGGGFDGVVYRFEHANGYLSNRKVLTFDSNTGPTDPTARTPEDEPLPRPQRGSREAAGAIAGLALSPDGKTLWAANAFGHKLERVDAETGQLLGTLDLGPDSYPYALALDTHSGKRLYVSLWGQARVAVVDIQQAPELVGHIPTEEHPNEMVVTRDGRYLFIANANRNTVTVYDTVNNKPLETINTAISPQAPPGCTPNGLALTPDESILLVANANTNDVAAFNVSEPGESRPLGFIPVGWYPTSVRIARDGKTVYVANGKGSTSKSNRSGPNPLVRSNSIREYIGGLFQGTLSLIPMPGPDQMGAYTKTVYECSPLDAANIQGARAARPEGNPIPAAAGEPSPITHCVYIIKENRTYDQVFGDLPAGNGDPALCLFPNEVTPNHHALASQFVLLDNFYVESEVSADGHEWTMAAYATDFVERTWPLSYRGDKRVPYPSEGKMKIAEPARGYLWDRAAEKGVSYFSFGEFIDNPRERGKPATTRIKALEGHFDPFFWGYDLSVPDQERADRFLEVLAQWQEKGDMPRLVILRLPNDHTSGTSPGKPTVTAMVADNDLALGRVVEGLSRSRFWPNLAIFVVEDDAQNGSDHVDAHRTVALAISPYIKRGSVDSTLYSTSSMLRTMELVLGLDPMSQFDAAARPMWNSFTAEPDLTPYRAVPARVDLKAVNTADAWGADISKTLNLAREDAADDLIFNQIIWKAVKGADSPMPPPVRAAFVVPAREDEDEDEDDDDD